jgi:gluconate 2-dehydrogenase
VSESFRPHVWVSQPLFDDIVARLAADFDLSAARSVTAYAAADIAGRLRAADGAIVTLNERIGAVEVADAPRLKVIANVGVGYNNLDVDALSAAGILVTNTPDVLTETTADFGFALMLAVARRIAEGDRMVRAGQWRQWSFDTLLGTDLHGRTLGILGMGRIGQAIARRAAGFGMRVLYHNRRPLPETTERELHRSTWISPACWRGRIT